MGVPAFFRWLTIRYPKVVIDAFAEDDLKVLAEQYELETQVKKQASDPNEIDLAEDEEQALRIATAGNRLRQSKSDLANKITSGTPPIDNLYLDMNGIIHPCSNPQNGGPQPQSEQEIFENIYQYTDKILNIIRPKKVLYLAIDGVAPRAKQN